MYKYILMHIYDLNKMKQKRTVRTQKKIGVFLVKIRLLYRIKREQTTSSNLHEDNK